MMHEEQKLKKFLIERVISIYGDPWQRLIPLGDHRNICQRSALWGQDIRIFWGVLAE